MRRAGRNFVANLVGSGLVLLGVAFVDPRTAQAQAVQGCQTSQYLDRTGQTADRDINWDFSITADPERCMQIQAGQTVVFHGDVLNVHPISGSGGTMPSPIDTSLVVQTLPSGAAASGSVTFPSAGTFGYQCLSHTPMKGAILVVAAPPPAAPALSPWFAFGLTFVLLASGLVVLACQRQHRRPVGP